MLNIKSLREKIYDYLKNEMQSGNLAHGSSINLNAVSRQLGISKTPLRDALISLNLKVLFPYFQDGVFWLENLHLMTLKNRMKL